MVCCVFAIKTRGDGEIRGERTQRKEKRGEAPRPGTLGRNPAPQEGHRLYESGLKSLGFPSVSQSHPSGLEEPRFI